MKHWVKGGHNYYYNLNTGQGTWEEPADFIPNNTQLNKEEIQVNLHPVFIFTTYKIYYTML